MQDYRSLAPACQHLAVVVHRLSRVRRHKHFPGWGSDFTFPAPPASCLGSHFQVVVDLTSLISGEHFPALPCCDLQAAFTKVSLDGTEEKRR